MPSLDWPLNKVDLVKAGIRRCEEFLNVNKISSLNLQVVPVHEWPFDVCAFYRPYSNNDKKNRIPSISICLGHCAYPCGDVMSRAWSWPGNTTDRTPYGVMAHETAHHIDWEAGEIKHTYFSEYGINVMVKSGEPRLTNYCPNPSEWFAEMGRLFITNPALLKLLRPKTYAIIRERFKPVGFMDWQLELRDNVPERVVKACLNKIKKGK